MNHDPQNNGKSFASILTETRDDLRTFVQTRVALLRAELAEKIKVVTRTAPLAAVALVLLGTAYLLFTLSLVGVVLALLPANPFRWCLAFLAVAVLWAIAGGIAAFMAMRRFALKELVPNRTIEVLKNDGLWIQAEVKTQL